MRNESNYSGGEEISRREAVKRITGGALAFGGGLALEGEVVASPEMEKYKTWEAGARNMKDKAIYAPSERLSLFRCDELKGLQTPGEWLTEIYGDRGYVNWEQSIDDFYDSAIEKGIRTVVHVHTHPQDPILERLEKRKMTRGDFFGRKPKEYPVSYPPSFMDSPTRGDAAVAYSYNKRYGSKLDSRYRIFDPRGEWKYGINMEHKYWQAYGRVREQYMQLYGELHKADEDVARMLTQLGKKYSGLELFEKVVQGSKDIIPSAVIKQYESFLAEHNANLVEPFRAFRLVRDTALDAYMRNTPHESVPNAGFIQAAYKIMGVNIEFQSYEALGI